MKQQNTNKIKAKNITVFGHSETPPEAKEYQEAFKVAAEVAKAGYTIVNGGGPGIMRASTEGAHSVGGHAVGITFYPDDATTFFEGRDESNEVNELLDTENYLERTLKLLEYGDIYLLFNGGTGTISEFGMAWGLARLHFGHHKPLILFGEFWNHIVHEFAEHMKIRPEEKEVYKIVTNVEMVVPIIHEFEEAFSKVHHNHRRKNPFTI